MLQLFESAAFLLSPPLYREFALPYQQRIFAAIKRVVPTIGRVVPTILFARRWENLGDLDAAGADIISLPASISIRQARLQLGDERVFQGNLDNQLLADGSIARIEAAARACVLDGGHRGHIFNLSHGLLRHTPHANIAHLVKTVRELAAQ